MKFLSAVWRHRTKVVGYLGASLAQLGTSGLITSTKAVAWIAFAASMCTLAIGHFNDYRIRHPKPVKPQGAPAT